MLTANYSTRYGLPSCPSRLFHRIGTLTVIVANLCLSAFAGLAQNSAPSLTETKPELYVVARSPFVGSNSVNGELYGFHAAAPDLWAQPASAYSELRLPSGRIAFFAVTGPETIGVNPLVPGNLGLAPFGPASADLFLVRVGPGVTASVGDFLQVGASLDVLWQDMALSHTDPDGRVKLEGDGMGLRGNLGLTVQLTENQRLGVSYRSPLDIDYSEGFPNTVSPHPTGGALGTELSTCMKYPTVLCAGYGLDLSSKVRLKADLAWLQYSKNKDLPLVAAHGLPAFPASVNEEWKDTFALGLGVAWRLGTCWVARAGYDYYRSPVPEGALSSNIQNADQKFLTVGLGFNYHDHAVEVAYGTDFYDARRFSESFGLSGTPSTSIVHLVSVSYRLVF